MSKDIEISKKDIIGICNFLELHQFQNPYALLKYIEQLKKRIRLLEDIIEESKEKKL